VPVLIEMPGVPPKCLITSLCYCFTRGPHKSPSL
jgi:hypothetical protein